MKNFLKKWLGPILILVTLAAVVVIGLVKGILQEAVSAVLNANPVFMLLCVLCYICYILMNSLSIRSFLKREGYDLKLKDSVTASLTGVYYSNITPGATGGQPMQIYYLSKFGIPLGLGTSAVICSLLTWHVVRVVMVIAVAVFNWDFIVYNMGSYWPFLLLGFAYNVFFVIMWLAFSFSKKPINWLVKVIGKIVTKFKLSKNPEKLIEGMHRTADKFYSGMQHLKSHPAEIGRQLVFGTFYMLSLISILYFAYRGVGLSGASYTQVSTMALCQYISAAYVPTPGSSGAQEGIFGLYFGKMMQGGSLLAVMMIWRFMSYYLGLLLGAAVNLINRRRFGKKTEEVVEQPPAEPDPSSK